MFTLKTNVNFSKQVSSNLLLSLLLITNNKKKVPVTIHDFLVGLVMIDNKAIFTKDTLRKVFEKRFPRLFNHINGNNDTYFDFYFNCLQSNFYTKKPIIQKINKNYYKVNNISSNLSYQTPHINLYKVKINDELINYYNGNMTKLIRDCSFYSLIIYNNTFINSEYNYKLIENIFGLSKYLMKQYMKENKCFVDYQYRHIGNIEAHDLELDRNLLGNKLHKIIYSFRIDSENTNLTESFNHLQVTVERKALFSIKDRLEHEAIRYTVKNYLKVASYTSCPRQNEDRYIFVRKNVHDGYYNDSTRFYQDRIKKYIEDTNINSYKSMQNIFNWLKCFFAYNESKYTFKETFNYICNKKIYQYC